ncbi:hypothetical protein TGAMA5MH_05516 [Trichoderma gamsii]|uniref:Uncharacterized protein n=1 Tax=Trichoderma gamsii TaxID=398673 RepID=A0A2K0TB78_9HYPO|nr:hypothetical protein TGAMA5MH_05516 [Trichoderma gamsii]
MASDKMDRGLDEIIADKRSNGSRNRRGGGGDRRRDRQDYPRDGVKKVRLAIISGSLWGLQVAARG